MENLQEKYKPEEECDHKYISDTELSQNCLKCGLKMILEPYDHEKVMEAAKQTKYYKEAHPEDSPSPQREEWEEERKERCCGECHGRPPRGGGVPAIPFCQNKNCSCHRQEGWEQNFTKMVKSGKFSNNGLGINWDKVKSFIHSLRLNTYMEGWEDRELEWQDKLPFLQTQVRQSLLKDLLAEVEGMDKKIHSKTGDWDTADYNFHFKEKLAFNSALSQVKEIINKHLK